MSWHWSRSGTRPGSVPRSREGPLRRGFMARTRKSPATAAGDDRATGNTRSRKPAVHTAEPRDAAERDLLQQFQYLDEMARQSKALMQDMRETQQRVLVESTERTLTVEDQLV